MNNKLTQLLLLIGLFATYAIAFGLGRWTDYVRKLASQGQISMAANLALWSFATLTLALCVLALYTWAFPRLASWVLICVVILGLLVAFIPVIFWLPALVGVSLGPLGLFLGQLVDIRGYVLTVGGWTAIAGIFTLLRRRNTNRKEPTR